ncbi:MAG TPA: hypothetical protein VFF79_12395 [Conexibacter sp.]|nr:hypothetical protein [Conexibacter sp.]
MSATTPVAFGLALEGDLPAGVRFNRASRHPGRAVRLTCSEAPIGSAIGSERTREGDAPAGLAIVPQPGGGHRISAAGGGSCVIAGDGSAIAYAAGEPGSSWRRLLVDQALPFAACAAGLECLHASAVAVDGRIVAVAGVSGAGKSSVALELARHGAAPIADDVVALEPTDDGGLLGHPALPRVGLRRAEAERLGPAAVAALGEVEQRDADSLLVTLASAAPVVPLPLGALYLIDRRADTGELAFEALDDPRLVLACTFNFVLGAPDRLVRLLELCHRLAAHAHLRRIIVPAAVDAGALATAIANDVAGRW